MVRVLEESGYRAEILDGSPEGESRWENIHELLAVAGQFDGYDRVGITFPGVVVDGVTRTAANVD